MNPRLLALWSRRLVLVAALLLAQHAGALHALGHLFDKGDAAPGHSAHACCIVYQGVDHAPATAAAGVRLTAPVPAGEFSLPRFAPRPAAATPFDSRAPPAVA